MGTTHPARRRFERWTSFYGMEGEIDGQGRVLIPPQLREPAAMQGDVVVLGTATYLEVWNLARAESKKDEDRVTDDDYRSLSDAGI
jgi:MraZ protein